LIVIYPQVSNTLTMSWGEQIAFRWDYDDVIFVPDKQAYSWIL